MVLHCKIQRLQNIISLDKILWEQESGLTSKWNNEVSPKKGDITLFLHKEYVQDDQEMKRYTNKHTRYSPPRLYISGSLKGCFCSRTYQTMKPTRYWFSKVTVYRWPCGRLDTLKLPGCWNVESLQKHEKYD